MYLKYGNYKHDADECAVTVHRQGLRSRNNVIYGIREHWNIEGRLHAADQSSVITAYTALKNAYISDGGDIGLYTDSGTAAHVLLNSLCMGGTRVVEQPDIPVGRGAEFSTYLNYHAAVEGDKAVPATPPLAEWQETITWSGGGPRFGFLPTLNGPPQKQLLQEQTTFKAVQRGTAVGIQWYPFPPPPIWPDTEHIDQRQLEQIGPERQGIAGSFVDQYLMFRITWAYFFEDASNLAGGAAPTLWPY